MSEEELLAKITEFAGLTDNWDSYGARPITQEAIDAATDAVKHCSPLPDWIVPTSKGGIQLEWYSNLRDFELEFSPNGRPSLLVTPKINGVCMWEETIEWSKEAREWV